MADIASKVTWTISSTSQGKVRLRGMSKYDVKDGAKVEAVNEVGGDDPVGFKDSPGAKTITFDFRQQKGRPVPDWDYLKRNKELFTLTRQIDGGTRSQFLPCRVSMVDPSGDDEGEHTFSVDIVALTEKPL